MKNLIAGRVVLIVMFLVSGYTFVYGQTITHTDGSALHTKYCYQDTGYGLTGLPAGGTFSGCGVTLGNGVWTFNPLLAAEGVSVFPYQCALKYTVNGQTVSRNLLVQKPVVIYPPLRDSQTCNGALLLQAGTLYAGAYQYRWEPAAPLDRTDTSIASGSITGTTTFRVIVTDASSSCTGTDSITVFVRPVPELTVSATQTINPRENVQLQVSGAASYQWSPATWLDNTRSAAPTASPHTPITYTVVGANEYGCRDTATVSILIREQLFVPNAFTPNGDGLNDRFFIANYGYQEVKTFRIFNRWGKEVFSTFDGLAGWDGSYQGNPAETGTYFYHIELSDRDDVAQTFRGELLLIR